MDDDLGDFRFAAVTRITADVPAAYPGGPSHKAGTPLYLSSLVLNEKNKWISFNLPSSAAMALNKALKAASEANILFKKIEYLEVATPEGPGLAVKSHCHTMLFDYFEECMAAVTFSFQALELFCNHTISRHLKEGMEMKRKKKREFMSPSELERQISTDEKLSVVVPKALKVSTPKGKRPWESFKKLKQARDATIHMKYSDQQIMDKDTLFFQFLNTEDVYIFPEAAAQMLRWFAKDKEPRWLTKITEVYGI
ncbi:hypothetical protein [Alteromonas sp. CYL-A6]|uniref:hypothetical protein n=1 Tax=Alteromonas nitratireducens TaxID=3390813 RepID=UPI0034B1BDFB